MFCERHQVKYDKECITCFIEQIKPLQPGQFQERIDKCTIQKEINDNTTLREKPDDVPEL